MAAKLAHDAVPTVGPAKESCAQWIVVTTIHAPSRQLRRLAAQPGWRLVVVGDRATPKEWELPGAVFLGAEQQAALGYRLCALLPWGHYARKNIGYLYAIAHGARVIYDTDDDTEPIGSLAPLAETRALPIMRAASGFVNTYEYFGWHGAWPRGYPLQLITTPSDCNVGAATACRVGMEQTVIDGEPDVDAVLRLTRAHDHVTFGDRRAAQLAPGTLSPCNSQSTFFHQTAFAALYLPSGVNMRACDVWRGYAAQRLLWRAGLAMAVSGAAARQERNAHDLLRDFRDEVEMHLKLPALIAALCAWRGVGGVSVDSMAAGLRDMTAHVVAQPNTLLPRSEVALVDAWVADLEVACAAGSAGPTSASDVTMSDAKIAATSARAAVVSDVVSGTASCAEASAKRGPTVLPAPTAPTKWPSLDAALRALPDVEGADDLWIVVGARGCGAWSALAHLLDAKGLPVTMLHHGDPEAELTASASGFAECVDGRTFAPRPAGDATGEAAAGETRAAPMAPSVAGKSADAGRSSAGTRAPAPTGVLVVHWDWASARAAGLASVRSPWILRARSYGRQAVVVVQDSGLVPRECRAVPHTMFEFARGGPCVVRRGGEERQFTYEAACSLARYI